MKHGFVKVLKLSQKNLDSERKVINVTTEEETKLSNYSFLVKTLETYNDRKFNENELITEFIKINLPKDEDQAREQWFEGIEYEGSKYFGWFATTGGMKKEDNSKKFGGKCDTIFIREDCEGFANLVENLISLGKFAELDNLKDDDKKKKICINKDVLSRLSLVTSDLITEIEMPNFIVLPTDTIDWIRDYKTVEPFKYKATNDDGNEVDKIDYKLIDYHFDTNKRDEKGNVVDEIEAFDGGGIATPKVFKAIGKSLHRNDIEFAIIRGYGLAIKGLITKFDVIGYLRANFKGETPYCRIRNGHFQLLDIWEEWQTVTDNTMILNESMVKLAKYYKAEDNENMNTYKAKMDHLNCDKWGKYHDLLNKLYITKVNKPTKEISDYRRINYQLLNALALTPNDYSKITKQDKKLFTKILKPYTCKKGEKDTLEFVINTDYINIFYKNCVGEDLSEEQEDFEEKLEEACNNVVDKINELININEEFVKLDYVKRNLRKLVEKKVRELACGKVTVKAKFQYAGVCPISYMNFAMTRNQGNNGLQEGQFYSGDCNDGDIRTLARNPLSAYSEVQNVEFVKNEYLDKWLSDCKEIIYYNQKSDIQNLMSSMDFDGDGITQIDDEIIRNAVVTPTDGKYFITKLDGKKEPLIYNRENRFISTFRASGNLIGKIALKSANVNCDSQYVPDYYDTTEDKFINRKDIKSQLEKENEDITKDEVNEYIAEQKECGLLVSVWDVEDKLKEHMKQKFYENEKEIYICLYNAMSAIDAPKTLKFLPEAYMEIIDSKYEKKVSFLQYKENREDVRSRDYEHASKSLLDRYSKYVQKELLDIIENNIQYRSKFRNRCDVLQKHLNNEGYCKETYDLCKTEIEKLYVDYNAERVVAEEVNKKANRKDKLYKRDKSEYDRWTGADEYYYQLGLKLNKQKKYDTYKEIDKKYIPIANQLIKTFDKETISKVIADIKKENMTENFILSLFFNCLKGKGTRYRYQKCEDGDIEYLYEKYRKIEKEGFDNSKVVDRIIQEDKINLNLEQKLRFKMNDDSIIKEITEGLENGSYELNLSDERIELFVDFADKVEDKETVKILKFACNQNGKLAITKKSFGVIVKA
ncbi:MAG: hypothetical protein N4A63_08195 [Vallitalea sp.]|nr:hypothetical protein [Vallitalea sp.]